MLPRSVGPMQGMAPGVDSVGKCRRLPGRRCGDESVSQLAKALRGVVMTNEPCLHQRIHAASLSHFQPYSTLT